MRGEERESDLERLCNISALEPLNITRDECNSVYLATEKETAPLCCVLHWSLVSLCPCRSSKSKRENGERWKTLKKQTEVFISCCCCWWCVKDKHHICTTTTCCVIRNNRVLEWARGLVQCLELWMLWNLQCGKEERGLWISANKKKACGEISSSLFPFSLFDFLSPFFLVSFLSCCL